MLGIRRFGFVWSLAVGLVGCSGDFVGLSGDDENGGTDGGADSGLSGDADTAYDDSTGGEDPGAEDSGGTGPGGDLDTDGFDCTLDCGSDGWCELDDSGRPTCACNEGFASNGLGCIPCQAVSSGATLDVPVSLLSFRVTVGGKAPPDSPYENGEISLRNVHTDDVVRLGQTRQEGFTVPIVPGRYEIYYSVLQGGKVVPANTRASLGTISLPDDTADEVVIDIPVTTITGTFSFDGAPAPDSPYENGEVFLTNPLSGDRITLGQTRQGEYLEVVVPGEYEAHYRWLAGDVLAPLNGNAFIQYVSAPADAGEVIPQTDIDIRTIAASGSITLDGAAPPDSPYENARVLLKDPITGDEFPVAETRAGAWSAVLVQGRYDVFYTRLTGGSLVPANAHAAVRSLDTSSRDFDIELFTAVISGDITIAGASAPTDHSDDGILRLRAPDGDDVVLLGNTHDQTYSRRVLQGTYDVYYSQETSSGGVPANTNARLTAVQVFGDAVIPIDVPAVPISGTFTLGGAPPPLSEYDDGRIFLRDPETGDSVLLGNTRFQTYSRLVVPGKYEVVYAVEAAGPEVPTNAEAIVGDVVVDGSKIDIDVPVGRTDGNILVGGGAPPPTDVDWGDLFLQDVRTADSIFLADTLSPTFSESLAAGDYMVLYRSRAHSDKTPANSNAAFACITITGD